MWYIKYERQRYIGISKHREESWKYDAQRGIFDEIIRCFDIQWVTVSSAWYIFSIETKAKEKTKK